VRQRLIGLVRERDHRLSFGVRRSRLLQQQLRALEVSAHLVNFK
jgi:hypothetical protein